MPTIPIITQNFSSPDVSSDTPLMLLPQAPLPDKDQDGFSQLILHDIHRHRQSYVRSYTAFETLKKRHDFVLRQENLRSLQNLEQRMITKQDQLIDQSIHSYEQCFVKVINGNFTTHGHLHEPPKHLKTSVPSFSKYHMHQLAHNPAVSLDPPAIIPFHRYQKSHRPPVPSRYRSYTNMHHSAQSFHDAFHSSSFSTHSQPFVSFTESYLQKYTDRSTNKFHTATNNDEMDELRERAEEEEDERILQLLQLRSASAEFNRGLDQNKQQEQKSKISDLQRIRTTNSSRNTITPSSTPQMSYNDAVRDGLTITKDSEEPKNTTPVGYHEKRPSSQQSTSQISNSSSKIGTKRSKTGKKKQAIVDSISDKKTALSTIKMTDNDLFKTAMTVQNYESNTLNQTLPSKIEHVQLPTNLTRKAPSTLRRSSIKSNDSNLGTTQPFDHIDTHITTTTPLQRTESPIPDNPNNEQILLPITNDLPDIKQDTNDQLNQQQTQLEVVENRKRIKKGAFDITDSKSDMTAFELGRMASNRAAMRKTRFRLGKAQNKNSNEDGTELFPENQETLDLLEKIRQGATGISVGQPPISLQSCRFELPFDLKLLETLTPLEYLSKYCRLSARRTYQFKRAFDKHRNNQHRIESDNLYTSIVDVHSECFTRSLYDYVCQLIDIGNEQHQFTYDTFAGILALCERILCDSTKFRSGLDEHDLAKDTIEKCDFDSLERKFDGLVISETMKRLLKTI